MGIDSIVEKLPHRAKQLLCTHHFLKPVVCIDPDARESDQLKNILLRTAAALNERRRVDFHEHSYVFSYSDYFVTYEPLFFLLHALTRLVALGEHRLGIDPQLASDLWEKSVEFHRLGRIILLADLSFSFESVFPEFSSIEQCFWYRRDRIKKQGMRTKTIFYISATRAERLTLSIEGDTRTAFRCCKKGKRPGGEALGRSG